MVKLASIDLGSNSTRLLITEVNDQGFNVLIRKHVVTKMSENIEQTGVISTEAFKRVNSTLRNFKKLLIANDVDDVFVIGTAALRDAKNSDEIIENIRKKYDFEVEVLSGHEEGITTSIGVLHFMENSENFLIIDIGGRSTEFVYEFENKIISKSLNLGVVTLSEKYFSHLPISKELIEEAKREIEAELSYLDIKNSEIDQKLINSVFADSGEPDMPLPVRVIEGAHPDFYNNPGRYAEPRRIQLGVQFSF